MCQGEGGVLSQRKSYCMSVLVIEGLSPIRILGGNRIRRALKVHLRKVGLKKSNNFTRKCIGRRFVERFCDSRSSLGFLNRRWKIYHGISPSHSCQSRPIKHHDVAAAPSATGRLLVQGCLCFLIVFSFIISLLLSLSCYGY